MNLYDISVQKINGEEISLSMFQGKTLLIVNTATKCGFTPQFEGLEKLWQEYKEKDFFVLGFPCDQFAHQEPTEDKEMEEVCKINHGVTFPLFAKINVNGKESHPLYQFLKSKKSGWFLNTIKWNFTKFLVDKEGNVVKRYAPIVKPADIKNDILRII